MKTFARNLLRALDLLLLPFTYLSLLWLRTVRAAGLRRMRFSRAAILRTGVFPVRNHFYEPHFDHRRLAQPWDHLDRALPGIELNVPEQLELLKRFDRHDELLELARTPKSPAAYDFRSGTFGPGDADFLYNVVRRFKPRRIFEIGCGSSSLLSMHALARNEAEEPARAGELVCIDPFAPEWLDGTRARVLRKRVETLGGGFFAELERNDLLFIDSSHMIRPQGDVLFELLELLPSLKPGVLVHVHDVYTPRDYPESMLIGKSSFWNEQYLLEAFLSHNRDFRVIGALNHLWRHHREALVAGAPLMTLLPGAVPASFWIVRN